MITPAIDNPMYFGMVEEETLYEKVMDCVNYLVHRYGDDLTVDHLEEGMELYDIDYMLLPRYMRAEFDYFNIVD